MAFREYLRAAAASGAPTVVLLGGHAIIEALVGRGSFAEAHELADMWAEAAVATQREDFLKEFISELVMRKQFWSAALLAARSLERRKLALDDRLELEALQCLALFETYAILAANQSESGARGRMEAAWVRATTGADGVLAQARSARTELVKLRAKLAKDPTSLESLLERVEAVASRCKGPSRGGRDGAPQQ